MISTLQRFAIADTCLVIPQGVAGMLPFAFLGVALYSIGSIVDSGITARTYCKYDFAMC